MRDKKQIDRRGIVIPDELYQKLKKEAEKNSITTAALIRLACSEYLEKRKRE